MKRNIIILLFSILSFSALSQNGTFHLICVIDRYSNIAESCKKDFDNIKKFITNVTNDLKIPLKVYDVEFYAAKSKKFITDFKCSPNDIVFFYYSGHGYRYNDQDVVWPFLNVCKSENDQIDQCALSLNWVYKEIEKKNPRLTISLGDCCNSLIGINEPKMQLSRDIKYKSQHAPEGYKNLFLETKGTIVASGSIPGQYSLGTEDGGIFSNSLIEVLTNSRENSSVNWKLVMAKATTDAESNSKKEQKPHFMVIDEKGTFYSEGNYPDNQLVVNNNVTNNDDNNVVNNNDVPDVNNVNDNPDDNTNDDYNIYTDDEYEEYVEEYDENQLQSDALFSMGLIYIAGLGSDDGNISETEMNSFYEFFNSTMTGWGYQAENVNDFIEKLSKWLENMNENEVQTELTNSLQTLKKSYDDENFNQIVFDNLKQMVDNPKSADFQQMLTYFKSLSD
jgi:hypothetical protein